MPRHDGDGYAARQYDEQDRRHYHGTNDRSRDDVIERSSRKSTYYEDDEEERYPASPRRSKSRRDKESEGGSWEGRHIVEGHYHRSANDAENGNHPVHERSREDGDNPYRKSARSARHASRRYSVEDEVDLPRSTSHHGSSSQHQSQPPDQSPTLDKPKTKSRWDVGPGGVRPLEQDREVDYVESSRGRDRSSRRSRSPPRPSVSPSVSTSDPSSRSPTPVDRYSTDRPSRSKHSEARKRRHSSVSPSRTVSRSPSRHDDKRRRTSQGHNEKGKEKEKDRRKERRHSHRDRSDDGERKRRKEERRSVLTGKKLKLKVHKDAADYERDAKRANLLQFLNSAYD